MKEFLFYNKLTGKIEKVININSEIISTKSNYSFQRKQFDLYLLPYSGQKDHYGNKIFHLDILTIFDFKQNDTYNLIADNDLNFLCESFERSASLEYFLKYKDVKVLGSIFYNKNLALEIDNSYKIYF